MPATLEAAPAGPPGSSDSWFVEAVRDTDNKTIISIETLEGRVRVIAAALERNLGSSFTIFAREDGYAPIPVEDFKGEVHSPAPSAFTLPTKADIAKARADAEAARPTRVTEPVEAKVTKKQVVEDRKAENGGQLECRDCHTHFPRPVGRGRPPVRCTECRAKRDG